MAPMALVTGAPGTVGTPLVHALIAAGVAVRIAARNVEAARAAFAGEPVEVVRFDFTDPSTFDVFAGTDRLFLLRPPQLADVPRHIVPALDAAHAAGLRRVAFLSIQGAGRSRLVPHHAIEEHLRSTGWDWTFIRAAYFMQNLATTHGRAIRERGEILIPAGRASRTAHVDVRDVAALSARVLVDPRHDGVAYTPTGPAALTYDECAAVLTRVSGRPIRYADPSPWAYWRRMSAEGMPRGMIIVTLGIYTAARLGQAAAVTDDVERVLGRPPRDFATFARDYAESWTATTESGAAA